MSTAEALSQQDIARLMENRESADAQMEIVQKLTSHYNSSTFDEKQAALTNDIFQAVLQRTGVQVRSLLAQNLSKTDKLPAEIARKMAQDVAEVANPILEFSNILSEEELLSIITAAEDVNKLHAIARRENVSETISEALVETKIAPVVSTLVQNEKATISEKTFEKIVEHHQESDAVMEKMFQRVAIPVAIIDKVVERMSETLRQDLETKYGDLDEYKEMKKALDQSIEIASIRMHGYQSSDQELLKLIKHLDSQNQLSPFSALCMGNLQLFEVSFSRMLRVPLKNIHILMKDPNGLKNVYDKAELPESLFEAVQLAVQSIQELEAEFSLNQVGYKQIPTPFNIMNRMVQLSAGRDVMGTDYLYAMMRQSGRENIRSQTGEG